MPAPKSNGKSVIKRKSGRKPAVKIDPDQLKALAVIFCTLEEAAAVVGMPVDRLKYHLKKPLLRNMWEDGRLEGKASLRRLQWMHAQRQDASGVQMAIHLGRHYLDQRERILVSVDDMLRHYDELTDTQLNELFELQAKALAAFEARLNGGVPPEHAANPGVTRH